MRDVHVEPDGMSFTCGEDGMVRAWRWEEQVVGPAGEDSAVDVKVKKERKEDGGEERRKLSGGGKRKSLGRYKPY